MSICHKLELVRREKIRRKLREQEERRRKHETELERLRKEEEERERERRWRAEERRVLREAAKQEEEARKAAEEAAVWVRFAAEEESHRRKAESLRMQKETEALLDKEHERQIEQARVLEQQRKAKLLAIGVKRRKRPTKLKASAPTSTLYRSPLHVRMSEQLAQGGHAGGGGGGTRISSI